MKNVNLFKWSEGEVMAEKEFINYMCVFTDYISIIEMKL